MYVVLRRDNWFGVLCKMGLALWTLVAGLWVAASLLPLLEMAALNGLGAFAALVTLSNQLGIALGGALGIGVLYLVFGTSDRIVDAEKELTRQAIGDDFSGAVSPSAPVRDPVLSDEQPPLAAPKGDD